MIFRRKPLFTISIILNVFLFLSFAILVVNDTNRLITYLKYPYIYVFISLSIILPILYASSRKLIISDSCIINSQIWGALKEQYTWNLFEDGNYFRNSIVHSYSSSNNTPWIQTLISKSIPATIRLNFIDGREPLLFNVKSVEKSVIFHDELKKHIKFSR